MTERFKHKLTYLRLYFGIFVYEMKSLLLVDIYNNNTRICNTTLNLQSYILNTKRKYFNSLT